MKRLFLFSLLIGYWSVVRASDTVFIKEAQVPILIERQDNLLFYLRFDARDSRMLDGVTVDLSRCKNLDDIQSVKLYYGGTEARQEEDKNRFAPVSYISSFSPGKTLSAYPSYSIKCAEESNVSESVVLECNYKLFPGVNFFWVSLQVRPGTSLLSKVTADLSSVTIDGKEAICKKMSPDGIVHRMGVGVRHAGNDGASAFRIPGLVTTNKGTLLGVYDVRYNSSVDLQEPVCMASLIHVRAEDNVLGRDILLFSNPNTKKGRNHITIKASLDKGLTWLPENQVMLDEDEGWGYTCLTMIDRETVGILYESSVAHMTFQAIKLKDLIRE